MGRIRQLFVCPIRIQHSQNCLELVLLGSIHRDSSLSFADFSPLFQLALTNSTWASEDGLSADPHHRFYINALSEWPSILKKLPNVYNNSHVMSQNGILSQAAHATELYNFYLLRIQWTHQCQSKSYHQSWVHSLNLRIFAMIVPVHTALKHIIFIFDSIVHWIFEHYLGGSGAPRIPSFCITCTSCILTPTLCMTFKNFSVQWTAQLF